MGKYRTTTLLAAKDVGAAATEVIDINVKGVISRINIYWQTKIVTVSVELASLLACIKKVELVDGSDILASLTGEQLYALNYYDRKTHGDYEASLVVNDFTKVGISLDFGRWIWDTMWGLDPSKFKNLQLKIQHSEALSNTAVVINELIVEAMVFDEKSVTPKGFFMNKEVFSYTPAASASEFIDLPTDHTIRKLLIQSGSTTLNPFVVLDQVKISEDNDRKIVFDLKGEEFWRTNNHMWPKIDYNMILDALVTAKTIFAVTSYDNGIKIEYDDTNFVTAQTNFAQPTYTNNKIALGASVDILADIATISGQIPFSVMCWPFGLQEDDTDWCDVRGIGSLQLINKGASSVGSSPTGKIILQQARLYR